VSSFISPLAARLNRIAPLTDGLIAAAEATARVARKKYRDVRRRRGYEALRPGPDTPLWNELARVCAHNLTRYGDKAKLARVLGVSRQRLHVLVVSRTACADAERTLQLLAWLQARRRGSDLA
jgi:hypothetical protein